jgi:hypothetical protein
VHRARGTFEEISMRLRLLGGALAALAAYMIVVSMPDVKRYLRMRSM